MLQLVLNFGIYCYADADHLGFSGLLQLVLSLGICCYVAAGPLRFAAMHIG